MAIRYLVLLAILISGCGRGNKLKVVPVSGSVKYKGAMVEGAVVTFVTQASPRAAVGVTDASGKFRLTTIDTNDGAMAGDNQVTITKMPPKGGGAKEAMKSPEEYMKAMQGQPGKAAAPPNFAVDSKDSIPAKYGNPTTSGLKRTVVAGETNNFNFELTD